MKNKNTVILTGASGDLGRELANALLNRGCDVVGIDCRPSSDTGLHHAVGFEFYRFDLASARENIPELQDLIAEVAARSTGDCTIVHCAGMTSFGHPDRSSIGMDVEVMDVNLMAPIIIDRIACQVFGAATTPRKLSLIHISSRMAERVGIGDEAYCVSKCALEAFSRALAAKYARNSNFVSMAVRPPGMVGRIQDNLRQQKEEEVPHAKCAKCEHQGGRLASAHAVAVWIAEHCVPASPLLNGQTISVGLDQLAWSAPPSSNESPDEDRAAPHPVGQGTCGVN